MVTTEERILILTEAIEVICYACYAKTDLELHNGVWAHRNRYGWFDYCPASPIWHLLMDYRETD